MNSEINEPPFNKFPFNTFYQVIDKMEYLGEEASPYEVSPGTDLCISDTYYSLGFLNYLHSFGKVEKRDNIWILNPKGKPLEEKPYRFSLISEAVDILQALSNDQNNVSKIHSSVSDLSEEKILNYLRILSILCQKGKIEQRSKGWDATFILTRW
ncbi:MAG: hypothetical protein ACFE8U_03945 [Candidatus Hermodarchaeota archaeon]